MRKLPTKTIALSGILAAAYAAVTLLWPFSYGTVQFRISDALCVLPAFVPGTTVGLTLGCLIANLFSTVTALDVLIGTLATLLGCLLTARCRKLPLIPLPTVLVNTLFIGAMLAGVYTPEAFWQGFVINGAGIAFGELVVMYTLGLPLTVFLKKTDALTRLTE